MVCQFWLPLACAVHVAPGATAASAKLGASFTAVTATVKVRVVEVDVPRKRIALTMRGIAALRAELSRR